MRNLATAMQKKQFTTRLPDALCQGVKAFAKHKRTTVEAVTEQALRKYIGRFRGLQLRKGDSV